ncbi:EAL domain-containing protein [uncultured Massilia sp.]|uniref:bifunctional diguanylate cyclase/phosphodiesterase n=1 Tax=uncultured Massilia sp. TaxID=169973 RepID=UPI0025CC5332|nr:EAL domain-containing protein [uncultured Massilia sp.]
MTSWLHRFPGALRLAVLVALLATFGTWLAAGNASRLPWNPAWYLSWHTAMEVFSVVVAACVFATGWHGVGPRIPLRVAVLAPVALAIGLLDFGHLMTVPGMPGLGTEADGMHQETAFWLVARGLSALALLAAAVAPRERTVGRRTHRVALMLALGAAACGFWLALVPGDLLPPTYAPDGMATRFKVAAELALIVAYGLATLLLFARAMASHLRSDRYLAAAAAMLCLSRMAIAIYDTPDDVFNVVGHAYKLLGYLFLFRAIYVAAVQAPYARLERSERSLAESEAKFRGLMECAPDAIVLAGADGRIAVMNACAEEMFGLGRDAAAGLPLEALVPSGAVEEEATGEAHCRRFHAGPFPAEVRRARMPTGQQVAIVRDVSERRRLEHAMVEQLTCDALTGLPNRRRVLETLDEAIGAARRDARALAVLVFDIDEFRKINSGYGWSGGDGVLRDCAARLAAQLRPGDTLARQGGNEFIIVQGDSGSAPATALAERLLACMREPFVLGGQRVFLSGSVGIALLPDGACDADGLLQMAQVAMHGARTGGNAQYRFHTAEMAEAIRERVDMEALLRHALERAQLTLQFQPRVRMADGAMVGVEALVRWRHPVLGLVPPGRFIPLAEDTGMIEELDMWVLREACLRAAGWRALGLAPVRVSVNLSARQFQQAGLARRVRAALEHSGLPPGSLEIEITESTVMRDTAEAADVLRSLKALGVALSIDDFGTGYSSLSYLKRFPLDVLKIDRSFVKDVIEDPNDAAITCAIIALAHGLNLEAVAEGVETAAQLEFLRLHGCDEVQGYYFSPPVWPEQLEPMLVKENFTINELVK